MNQYRGPGAIEFVDGLIHNYGELVVKLHGLFNVSIRCYSARINPHVCPLRVATYPIRL